MSQKNYSVMVVLNLLRGDNHIRGLAKSVGTNQTTISRKMAELQKGNIVDFRTEGRNKVFFIKKSLEAKQYACIAEMHKLLDSLNRYPKLRAIFEKIKKDHRFSLAVLFGSYAKGMARKESDIDIYIETKDQRVKQQIEGIDTRLSIKIGMYDKKSLLIKEIEKDHIIIKGAEEYYEKNQLFE